MIFCLSPTKNCSTESCNPQTETVNQNEEKLPKKEQFWAGVLEELKRWNSTEKMCFNELNKTEITNNKRGIFYVVHL